MRQCKSNPAELNSELDYSDNKSVVADNSADTNEFEINDDIVLNPDPFRSREQSLEQEKNATESIKRKKHQLHTDNERDEIELQLMRNFNIQLIKKMKQDETPEIPDSVDCFLKSLGADLRSLPEIERVVACHEIRQVIYKYQLTNLQRNAQPALGSFLYDVLQSPTFPQQKHS